MNSLNSVLFEGRMGNKYTVDDELRSQLQSWYENDDVRVPAIFKGKMKDVARLVDKGEYIRVIGRLRNKGELVVEHIETGIRK